MRSADFGMEKGAVIVERKVDLSDAALSDKEVKRIFIGGVGAGVTAIDVENTFSPLGRVHDVEFVRHNGRNFAYMDFSPSSVRSLAKLFSTYNGCTWKGGKLKLEIAKEHYFARLKREWAEDAKLASATPPTKESLEFVRSHCSSQENSQIRIFFPNLRKVKPLPFKGTGKHKYSFQRIEVPPLPINFCDCEEHSKALETISPKFLSPLSIVVHEKERSIITNVINKLMGGDSDEIPSDRKTQFVSNPKILSPRNEGIQSIEAEISDAEDDNLVMNISVGAEDDILMQLKGGMTQSACQESGFSNPQSSKDRLIQNKTDSGKRKKPAVINASPIKPNKRTRPISTDGPFEPAPAITQKLTSSTFSGAEPLPSFCLASPDASAHAPKIPTETPNTERQMRPNMSDTRPTEGQSWLQKSSWKDLVGGRESSSFSISNVMPHSTSTSPDIPNVNASDDITSKKSKPFVEKSKQKTPRDARITPKIPIEAPNAEKQNRPNISDDRPSEGQSWLQKSSWKDLVGGRSSSSFSISNILPGLTSKHTEMQNDSTDTVAATTKEPNTSEEKSKSKQKAPENVQISPGINPKAPISAGAIERNIKESSSSVQGKHSDFSFGEVCLFMGNAESEQQWSKAKAALSGYLKKRNSDEGNASKFSKGKASNRH